MRDTREGSRGRLYRSGVKISFGHLVFQSQDISLHLICTYCRAVLFVIV